jgi:hypothetical protein
MRQGLDANGDDAADAPGQSTGVDFGRGQSVDLAFAPGATTVIAFSLDGAETDIRDRPDLAVSARDLTWRGGALEAMVHSLGSRPAVDGVLRLEDATGAVLAEAPVPELAAPNDLTPKRTTVRLQPPRGADLTGATVRLVLPEAEISAANNRAALPGRR